MIQNFTWTAMVLDFLPYRQNRAGRIRDFGVLRYAHFIASAGAVVIAWFVFGARCRQMMYVWFVAGNVLYYAAAIGLAFALKDNRAFCKYACPVPVIQKAGSASHCSRSPATRRSAPTAAPARPSARWTSASPTTSAPANASSPRSACYASPARTPAPAAPFTYRSASTRECGAFCDIASKAPQLHTPRFPRTPR